MSEQGLTIIRRPMFAKFSSLRMEKVPHVESELILETIL